jgi:hypothetical protein
MTIKDIIYIINSIENNFQVENWKINGIHSWPIVRSYLAEGLRNEIVELHEYKSKYKSVVIRLFNRLLLGLIYLIKSKILDYKNDQKIKGKYNILFLTNTTFRRSKIKAKWYDIYTFPIIEEFAKIGMKSYVLELSLNYTEKFPRYNKTNLIEFKRDIYYLFQIIISKLSRKKNIIEMVGYDQIQKYMKNNHCKIKMPKIDYFTKRIRNLQYKAKYYSNYIKRTKCTVGIVNGYGSDDGMAFCLACSKSKIISIEIQHGMISEFMPRYGSWHKVPEYGYELLPNIFWTWSDYETKFINEWAAKHSNYHRAIEGGFFWSNKWRNGLFEDLVNSAKTKIYKKESLKRKFIILVTLQSIEFEPCWLKNAMVNSPENYYWLIRFHPSYDNVKKRQLFYKYFVDNKFYRFNIEDSTTLPLMAILNFTNVLCTSFSSSVLDAKFLNVRSVVYHSYGIEHYKYEIKNGWVEGALTEKEFSKTLKSLENKDNNKMDKSNLKNIDSESVIELVNNIKLMS